jgi:cytochrome c-type biogenesis protein CcmH
LLREQLSEIDADLRSGVLSADQYENARVDLERRVLDESQQAIGPTSRAPIGRRWRTPVVVGLFVPVCAALLYVYLGSFDGLDVEAYMQKQAAAISPEQVVSMTRQLAQRLEKEPDDVEGWMMLGRSYMVLQQYPDSARAWQRAATLAPDNASILTNYAEAIALASQGNFDGEAARLLARALDADPVHPKALALSGGAAYGRGEYRAAIDYWQRLLLLGGDDGELSAALMTGIAKAQERLNEGTEIAKASGSMRGVVSLSPQMSANAKSGDTVFIFVRAADGPRMPLAVARVTVDELPYDFHLDDSMAMVPDKRISDFQQLVVGARVSGTGTAGRTSGDLEGFSTRVGPVSSGIQVLIDRRVP